MTPRAAFRVSPFPAIGERKPREIRPELAGRDNIVMTEWGPWDHRSAALRLGSTDEARRSHVYELLGAASIDHVEPLGVSLHKVEHDEIIEGRQRVTVTGPDAPASPSAPRTNTAACNKTTCATPSPPAPPASTGLKC